MEICFVVSTSPKMEKLMFLKQKYNALTSKCVRIIGPTLPVWIPYRLNQNKNQMTERYIIHYKKVLPGTWLSTVSCRGLLDFEYCDPSKCKNVCLIIH